MKNKILAIVLTMAVLTSLTGCAENNTTDRGNTTTANNSLDSSDKGSKTKPSVSKDGKVLVAYFAVAEN